MIQDKITEYNNYEFLDGFNLSMLTDNDLFYGWDELKEPIEFDPSELHVTDIPF